MNRIVIIGTSCSGKTTLAKELSKQLNIKHIELDELHWKPNWEEREKDEFIRLLDEEISSSSSWVVDGNYAEVRELLWSKATTIIWLNYAFPLVLGRAILRTIKRVATQQEVCAGNKESFRQAFLSQESIIWWVIKTHRSNNKRYNSLLYGEKYKDIKVVELTSQNMTDRFLK